VITGEVGAGKTAAVRGALAGLDQARHTSIYLPDPTVGVRGIHHAIVTALGGRPPTAPLRSPPVRRRPRHRARRTRPHPRAGHRRSPLLQADQLESVRMLTNHAMDSAAMFACLLVGQPTLRRRLKLGQLAALDQRIAVRYT